LYPLADELIPCSMCQIGLTSNFYNDQALGGASQRLLLSRSAGADALYPHLSVAAGNTSRAAFTGVARRGGLRMPRGTPELYSNDMFGKLTFPPASFELVLCTGCDKVGTPDAHASPRTVYRRWATVAGETLRMLRVGGLGVMQLAGRWANYKLGSYHEEGATPSALFDGGNASPRSTPARRVSAQEAAWLEDMLAASGGLVIELAVGSMTSEHAAGSSDAHVSNTVLLTADMRHTQTAGAPTNISASCAVQQEATAPSCAAVLLLQMQNNSGYFETNGARSRDQKRFEASPAPIMAILHRWNASGAPGGCLATECSQCVSASPVLSRLAHGAGALPGLRRADAWTRAAPWPNIEEVATAIDLINASSMNTADWWVSMIRAWTRRTLADVHVYSPPL